MTRHRATRGLSWFVGITFIVLGLIEVAVRVLADEPVDASAVLWWSIALCGGGTLVLLGSFVIRPQGWALAAVLVGAVLGMLATAWTVLLPLVVLTMLVLRILGAEQSASTGGSMPSRPRGSRGLTGP